MGDTLAVAAPDYWRQLDVFNPEAFTTDVHIIGVGATGSWIAYILAKMGVAKIHVWDFDQVEAHNLPNQIFGRQDVGRNKVDALRDRLDADCGTVVIPHCERVDGSQKLSGIIYLCIDGVMSNRKKVWEKAIKLQLGVKLMVETRLGAELGIIHTVRPMNRADIRGFEASMHGDDEGEESACTYRAIATTVSVVAGLAAHKLIKLAAGEDMAPVVQVSPADAEHSSYEMICIRPVVITATEWEK